jgi:RNA polymerase sigma-70 factor (TIGR02960 family)
MTLIARARAGDGDAFRALTEPHRRELHMHCYRMLGSVQDAEDTLQETLVAAWKGLAGFNGNAAVRTWLYRIATNTCLNAIRAQRRRPAKAWDVPGIQPSEPTGLGEVPWLRAYPDPIDLPIDLPIGPEARYEQTESISLAFITALQLLPPRQLAVLVLRDVLGFHAAEVADMLDTTIASVNGALTRARARLAQARRSQQKSPPPAGSRQERAIVTRFVRAYESADVAELLKLFSDDIFLSMPPMPHQYEGKPAVAEFMRLLLVQGRRYRLISTRANYQPAFGAYLQRPDGTWHATGLFVATLAADLICAISRFEAAEFHWFGLSTDLQPV